jgi:hypothetical protein
MCELHMACFSADYTLVSEIYAKYLAYISDTTIRKL